MGFIHFMKSQKKHQGSLRKTYVKTSWLWQQSAQHVFLLKSHVLFLLEMTDSAARESQDLAGISKDVGPLKEAAPNHDPSLQKLCPDYVGGDWKTGSEALGGI